MLVDEELRALFHLIMDNAKNTAFTKELGEYIEDAKRNNLWKEEYMIAELNYNQARNDARRAGYAEGLELGKQHGMQQGIQEGIQQGIQEGMQKGLQKGIQQGLEEKAVQTALNLLKLNLHTPEQIADSTGLPLSRVLELKGTNQ